ncbi:hypothetical protein ABZV77_06675 [Streptomyces sp. NPDC004732]|uniref:hypothetical protein n=1 Tax=Streptomyces sp. NPDC004732 TaxID=3154290 RepID=UPI0033BBC6A9
MRRTPPGPAEQLANHLAEHAAATHRLAAAMDGVTAALEATALALSTGGARQQERSEQQDAELTRLTDLVRRHEDDLRTLLSEANERRKDIIDERGRLAQDVAVALHRFFLRVRHVGTSDGGPFNGRSQPDPEQALFVARVLRSLLSPSGHAADEVTQEPTWPAKGDGTRTELAAEAAQLCAAARRADVDFTWDTTLTPEYWTGCPRDGTVAFAVRPGATSRHSAVLPALVYTIGAGHPVQLG